MAESSLKKTEAIISSMTVAERRDPELLNASRRRRIAAGSGTTVQDINMLVKQFREMQKMMKQMGIMGMGRSKKKKQKGKQGRSPLGPGRGMPGGQGGLPSGLPPNWMDMFKGGN
jgi:signal recognition particle subunit SRP54